MYCACGLQASVLGNRAAARMDRPCQCGILKPRSLMGRVPAIRDYLSGSKPRMRGFEPVWWISCSRFKHCAMVLVLSAIGSFAKVISGMPVFVPSRRKFLFGQPLQACPSQEVDRSPVAAPVNFRAEVQQFDRSP